MARRIESHWIECAEPRPGRLEALLEEPEDRAPLVAVLLCHPHPLYGGTMHNRVVYRMARGLRQAGAVVLRFNFRGVEGAVEDAATALGWLRGGYSDVPFALAGFSFGARVAMELGCRSEGAEWLMAAGFPTRWGVPAYLEGCGDPKIFLQSTNDEYGPRGEFEQLFARTAEPKELHWIEASDHFFAGGLDELEERCGLWGSGRFRRNAT